MRTSPPAPGPMSSKSGKSAAMSCTNVRPPHTESMAGGLERAPDDVDASRADALCPTPGRRNPPTEINKDLIADRVARAIKLSAAAYLTAGPNHLGGLYFGTEDKPTGRYAEDGGTTGKLDAKVPWTNIKVRQAINKAINRDELLKVLYKGRATPMYVHGFYPDLPGWDPTWEKRFPEMYGYDPKAAQRLLAEAGFPKGFKAKGWLFPFAGAPGAHPFNGSCAGAITRGWH